MLVPILLLTAIAIVPATAKAAVVINEILFDPSGTDTGLEKIELYNPDAAATDMGGWELYPDGIGYFSFPGEFSLAAQSFVTIHLRASGTNDAVNLYHAAASKNMGDSSGSVALFRPGGRTKDTIVDFTRYHKPGISPPPAERKTWESDAVKAGFWVAGTFADVTSIGEGSSIGLMVDGSRGNASAWTVYAAPTIGSANSGMPSGAAAPVPAPTAVPAESTPSAVPVPPPTPAPPPVPSLGADAGPDIIAIAGAIVQFEGLAFGLDGKPLDSARFFWNFGDGSTQEKQSPTHIFHFPGTYYVNLSVQSGHYAGSDWRTVTVLPAEIGISEVKPGGDGFIELFNRSAVRVDLGGMFLTDDQKLVFRIPFGTVIGPKNVVIFPAVNTHLVPVSYLNLRDARGVVLDEAKFNGSIPAAASWERVGTEFRPQQMPTPGKAAEEKMNGRALAVKNVPVPPPLSPVSRPSSAGKSAGIAPRELSPAPSSQNEPVTVVSSAAAYSAFPAYTFFAVSAGLGLATALGILWLKRMTP